MDSIAFRRAGHLPTLLACSLYFAMSCLVWLIPGALANSIASDFGLSEAQKGLMVAVPLLGVVMQATGRFDGGFLALALFGDAASLALVGRGWRGPQRTGAPGRPGRRTGHYEPLTRVLAMLCERRQTRRVSE